MIQSGIHLPVAAMQQLLTPHTVPLQRSARRRK